MGRGSNATGMYNFINIFAMARKYRHFVYEESQRFIYPTSDWGFKYLLGSEKNKDLLIGILRELLPDLGIESVEYLPQEVGIPIRKMKKARFDVHCRLLDGSRIVVEMQNYAYETFLDRAVVYTAAAILDNYVNTAAKEYQIGKTVFIAFVGDPLFKNTSRSPIRLSLCDVDELSTTLRCDRVLQIFIELPKFGGSIEDIKEDTPFVEQLAYALMEMADCDEIPANITNPLIKRLFEAADLSEMDTDMKTEYKSSILSEADYEYLMAGAKKEGLLEGLLEGRAEGRAEGHAEGLAEGRAEGIESVARAMKKQGAAMEMILSVTGLAEDAVSGL